MNPATNDGGAAARAAEQAELATRRGASKRVGSQQAQMAAVVEGLLAKAEEALAEFDVNTALNACQAALKSAPDNSRAWDLYGETLLTATQPEEAHNAFTKSVELAPNDNHAKYMYLGQMNNGVEAIEWFSRGVALLQTQAAALPAGPEQSALLGEVSDALVTCAEIYLTDACFEPDAEERCAAFVQDALAANPGNPEAYQTLASFRLSQQNPEEAGAALMESFRLWSMLPEEQQPSYEFRLTSAKLFLELEESGKAVEIVDRLLVEDDRQVNAWYVRGLAANFEGDLGFAAECLENSLKIAQDPEVTAQDEDNALFVQELAGVMATLQERIQAAGGHNEVPPAE